MQAVAAAAKAAITSPDSALALTLTINWPGGVYPDAALALESYQLDGELDTDMPDDTTMVVGYQSRKLTVTLAGMVDRSDEAKTIAWLVNPLSQTSPLYRKDLRGTPVSFGRGPFVPGSKDAQTVRRFTGVIDDFTINPDGSVELECLDPWTTLRGTVDVPAVVTAPPSNAGLTSEYALDALLRNASAGRIATRPARRPLCVLDAGMRSSLWPEVGVFGGILAGAALFVRGVWGSAYAPITSAITGSTVYTPYTLSTGLGDDAQVEFAASGLSPATGPSAGVYLLPASGGGAGQVSIIVTATQVQIAVHYSASSDTWTITAPTADTHQVSVHVNWPATGTTWSADVQVDGTVYHSGARAFGAGRPAAWAKLNLLNSSGSVYGVTAGIEALQVTAETALASSFPFTPSAVIDQSSNSLLIVPAMSGSTIDIHREICAAERGVGGFDEYGVYRFLAADSRRGGAAVDTVTSTSTLETASIQVNGAAYANRVQASYTDWVFGATGVVWSASTVVNVPARQTISMDVTTSDTDTLICGLDTSVMWLADGDDGSTGSVYRASLDQYGNGAHPGGLTFTIRQLNATTIRIGINNPTGQDAWLVQPATYTDSYAAGSPMFWIAGIPVTRGNSVIADAQWPPAAEGGAASSAKGEVLYAFPDSDWRQLAAPTQHLVDETLCETSRVTVLVTGVEVVPDDTRQIGDRIHLVAPALGLDDDVIVFGVHDSGSAGQATQQLDVRLAAPPGVWVLGIAGRTELGHTTYV